LVSYYIKQYKKCIIESNWLVQSRADENYLEVKNYFLTLKFFTLGLDIKIEIN